MRSAGHAFPGRRRRIRLADPFEVLRDVVRALPALVAILLETLRHEMLQRGRGHRLNRVHRLRLALHDRGDQAGARLPLECTLSRRHLVEHRAQRKDVRASVSLGALELLGRHVLKGTDDGAFLGQRFLVRCTIESDGSTRGFSQTEVEQLRTRLREHDVARLQIAVHDSRTMGALERFGDLRAEAQDVVNRQGAAQKAIGERLTFEQLHHQVPVADVIKRADVGMIQLRNRLRFALKSSDQLRVRGELRRQHFDRHAAIEARVASAPDLPHAAGTERRDDLVRPETSSRSYRFQVCRPLSRMEHEASQPGYKLVQRRTARRAVQEKRQRCECRSSRSDRGTVTSHGKTA